MNYPMRRKPRGRAIILNIVHYGSYDQDSGANTRRGASVDERNMKNLLQKLDFTVDVWRDVESKMVCMNMSGK